MQGFGHEVIDTLRADATHAHDFQSLGDLFSIGDDGGQPQGERIALVDIIVPITTRKEYVDFSIGDHTRY